MNGFYIYFLYLCCFVIIYESLKWFYNDIYEAHFAAKRDSFIEKTLSSFNISKNNNNDREYIDVDDMDSDDVADGDENIRHTLLKISNQLKNGPQNQSIYYINFAIDYDKKGRYSNALENYTNGIGVLLPLAKSDINIKFFLEYYMNRAEHLKSEQQKSKPNIIPLNVFSPKLKTTLVRPQQQIQQPQQQQQQQQQVSSPSINDSLSNLSSIMRSNRNSIGPITQTTTNNINNSNGLKTSNGIRNPLLNNNNNSINRFSPDRTVSSSSLLKTGLSTSSLKNSNQSKGSSSTIASTTIIPDIKGVDKAMIATIMNEVLETKEQLGWETVIGLEKVKQTLTETVILPNLRPDIFTGLRSPPKGLLLYGPPGNGKTLIAKVCAYESNLKFFSISASSLTSKYVGDGEKLVRALFAVARHFQPSIIFIDEIDSLLTSRNSNDSESARRIKTEILVQFDGVRSTQQDRILVMGATNRPGDLDDAALRRMAKRIYVGLPEKEARKQIIRHYLSSITHNLTDKQIDQLGDKTDGYSGHDLYGLVKDAAYQPIRELGFNNVKDFDSEIRPTNNKDFLASLKQIRPSVDKSTLKEYEVWSSKFGAL
ncbi:hypothetical protein CYY_007912 [Polysphondylium violaceum]|uniref:microtubule-severing ATPase n=1 Tax=Polysphondylium violaceum TaxID=133409 RepID=A0A8J4PNY9_9MYCE|nr:hypothetical protein CYY_007912 [Polysphondylium violaceum]